MVADPKQVDAIVLALRGFRFLHSNEKELQEGIARALKARGIRFEREKNLGEGFGVVDFLIGRIAIEVKIKGSPSEVARQLLKYCGCPDVDEIVLFTSRARLGVLPSTLGGKALHVVAVWESFL